MNQVTALHFQFSHHKTHHLAQWPSFDFGQNHVCLCMPDFTLLENWYAETQNFRISFGYIGQKRGEKN